MLNPKKKSPLNCLTTVDNGKLYFYYGCIRRDLFASMYGKNKYQNLCYNIHKLSSFNIKETHSYWVRHTKRINFILRIKYKL